MKKFIVLLANSQHYFVHALRVALFIVLAGIGGYTAFYEQNVFFYQLVGVAMLSVGVLTVTGIWFYKTGLIGGLLIAIGSLVALTALIIDYSTFNLPGAGLFLLLLIAGLICASDCAKQIFREYVLRMGKA